MTGRPKDMISIAGDATQPPPHLRGIALEGLREHAQRPKQPGTADATCAGPPAVRAVAACRHLLPHATLQAVRVLTTALQAYLGWCWWLCRLSLGQQLHTIML